MPSDTAEHSPFLVKNNIRSVMNNWFCEDISPDERKALVQVATQSPAIIFGKSGGKLNGAPKSKEAVVAFLEKHRESFEKHFAGNPFTFAVISKMVVGGMNF